MTRPRKELVSLSDTPYYHVTARCVRQAFLCGVDKFSGRSYEHRRQWIVDRVRLLSSLFAIDVCAYAVMHNHYHLVLKICPEQLVNLSDHQIIDRWCSLFKGPLIVQNFRSGQSLTKAEASTLSDIVALWRNKLSSLSWFMRCLNQNIARQANIEDQCTGKFWECRFSSQALKTEEALLSCMAYVDLNPIRAKLHDRPEDSHYTSIEERIKQTFSLSKAIDQQTRSGNIHYFNTKLKPLLPFERGINNQTQTGIPYDFKDYLQLVDWTGRVIREDKRGSINLRIPPILTRLKINAEQWRINTTQFESIHARRFNRLEPNINTG